MYIDFQILPYPCGPGVIIYHKEWVFELKTQRYVARGTLHACIQNAGGSPQNAAKTSDFFLFQKFHSIYNRVLLSLRCGAGVATHKLTYLALR